MKTSTTLFVCTGILVTLGLSALVHLFLHESRLANLINAGNVVGAFGFAIYFYFVAKKFLREGI